MAHFLNTRDAGAHFLRSGDYGLRVVGGPKLLFDEERKAGSSKDITVPSQPQSQCVVILTVFRTAAGSCGWWCCSGWPGWYSSPRCWSFAKLTG